MVGWFNHFGPFDNDFVISFLLLKIMLDFSEFSKHVFHIS